MPVGTYPPGKSSAGQCRAKGRGFSDSAPCPKQVKEVVWKVCCLAALGTILLCGRCTRGWQHMYLFFVLFSDLQPHKKAPKTSTKTASSALMTRAMTATQRTHRLHLQQYPHAAHISQCRFRSQPLPAVCEDGNARGSVRVPRWIAVARWNVQQKRSKATS